MIFEKLPKANLNDKEHLFDVCRLMDSGVSDSPIRQLLV